MPSKKKLGDYIDKWHIKKSDWKGREKLQVLGVSNTEGITTTSHKKSKDLSNYLVVEPDTFAYNPYRINVGSIGLTPQNTFGLVSPAYTVFKVIEKKVIPELLLDYLKSFEGLQQINKYARGTVRKALRYDDLCKIEVNFPEYEKQKIIFEKKLLVEQQSRLLLDEIQSQKVLVTQLKQSILQEAIQGKLTREWREENPELINGENSVEALLKNIKAEKARLIKEKKIKKEKSLTPITEEEIPFELPVEWVWCRLGNLSIASDAGKSLTCVDRKVAGDEWGILKVSATSGIVFRPEENKFFASFLKLKPKYAVKKGDFILSRANTQELVGNSVIVEDSKYNLLLSDKTVRFHFTNDVNKNYINISNKSSFLREYFINNCTGSSPSMKNLSRLTINEGLLPLPPLEEQKAIVAKVEALMEKCSALEQQIIQSEAHAQMLMQAVLKEAFEGEKKTMEPV